MALGRDGKRLWSINLKAAAGRRRLWSRITTVWFLTSDGNLHVRARSDGAELDRIALGILPDGGLLQAGKQVLVSAGRGTIRPWRPCSAPPANLESSDRKAGSVKRLVASFCASALVDGSCCSRSRPARAIVAAAGAGSGGAGKTTDELLRAVPFDRITLIDGTVMVVDPVSPRPLPTIDPAKEREKKRRREKKEITARREHHPRACRPSSRCPNEREGSRRRTVWTEDEVKLHLLQGGAKEIVDFKVKRASIKKIEYFEDMLLEECDRLVALHDYTRAFECCLRVQTRNPGWHGLYDHVNRVLFAEGSKALIDGDGERGLRLLRELLGRKRDYPGLLDQIGEAYGKRIERAFRWASTRAAGGSCTSSRSSCPSTSW